MFHGLFFFANIAWHFMKVKGYVLEKGHTMKYRTIETSRELRLWIGQIVIPIFTVGATLMTIPEVRNNVVDQAGKAYRGVQHFINNVTGKF